jgi:hypothetical protein
MVTLASVPRVDMADAQSVRTLRNLRGLVLVHVTRRLRQRVPAEHHLASFTLPQALPRGARG